MDYRLIWKANNSIDCGGGIIVIEKSLVVKLKNGLQARPAALFVQEANRYSSNIYLEKDRKKVNAKSIMGIMSLAIGPQSEIKLLIDGPDEEEVMSVLTDFVGKEEM